MLKKIFLTILTAILGCLLSYALIYFNSQEQTRFMNILKLKNKNYYSFGNEHFYGLPLNNPPFLKASVAKHMSDEDLVIGINHEGTLRAYPGWVLASYNIINDTVDGKPILVTYCKECHAAGVYIST